MEGLFDLANVVCERDTCLLHVAAVGKHDGPHNLVLHTETGRSRVRFQGRQNLIPGGVTVEEGQSPFRLPGGSICRLNRAEDELLAPL